jgi:hypothetical protein
VARFLLINEMAIKIKRIKMQTPAAAMPAMIGVAIDDDDDDDVFGFAVDSEFGLVMIVIS